VFIAQRDAYAAGSTLTGETVPVTETLAASRALEASGHLMSGVRHLAGGAREVKGEAGGEVSTCCR